MGQRSLRTALVPITAVAVAACQPSEAEKTCDALVAQLEACHLGPEPLPRSTRRYCEVTLSEQADPARGESLLTVAQRALRECSAPTTCPAFRDCLARHQCVMLMASPTDEPQFECSR